LRELLIESRAVTVRVGIEDTRTGRDVYVIDDGWSSFGRDVVKPFKRKQNFYIVSCLQRCMGRRTPLKRCTNEPESHA